MSDRQAVKAGLGQVLRIGGMTCGGCANSVQRVLARVPGVTGASVDFETSRAVIEGQADVAALVAAVTGAGFQAEPVPAS